MKNFNEESQSLNKVLQTINKEYGANSIIDMNLKTSWQDNTISSGSILLDQIIGIGGYPKGRIIEIYGNESSGKTTLALHAIKSVQDNNGLAAFIDVEHALDANYIEKIGINLQQLIVSQPDSAEHALGILEILVRSKLFSLIVIDSVAALTPQIELDGEMSSQTIGVQARLMSKALRKINTYISQSNCLVIFINQIREKVGIIFGNPEITPGGRALRFYASLRLELKRSEQIINNNQLIGYKLKIKIVKNKVAVPFKTTILDIYFDKGICLMEEIITLAIQNNLLQKNGTWYNYGDEKIGQGREKVRDFLLSNNNLYSEIVTTIKKIIIK